MEEDVPDRSSVSRSLFCPPSSMRPLGESQLTCPIHFSMRLWEVVQAPLLNVVQVSLAGETAPPQAVRPDWEWRLLL